MANVYQTFKSLLPDASLLTGTVTLIQAGNYVIQLPGGGVISARGQAKVGQKVFVRDGVIEGIAPNLTVQVIEV